MWSGDVRLVRFQSARLGSIVFVRAPDDEACETHDVFCVGCRTLQKDHQRHYEGVCLRLDEVC